MIEEEKTFDVYSLSPGMNVGDLPPEAEVCKHLPYFILPHQAVVPAGCNGTEKRSTDNSVSYIRLLKGLDFLSGYDPDAINLSLGPAYSLPGDDPLLMTCLAFHAKNIPVIVAAGNYGVSGEGTLQPLATSPPVISVGATDKQKKLLASSSRGTPGGLCPTVVTDGSPLDIDTPIKYPPETSFAAPRVSRLVLYLQSYLRLLVNDIFVTDKDSAFGAPIRRPRIGIADTGVNPDLLPHSGSSSAFNLGKGVDTIRMSRSKEERDWYSRYFRFLNGCGITTPPLITPEIIKKSLELSATRFDNHKPFEIGAGYVDEDAVDAFLLSIDAKKLTNLLYPDIFKERGLSEKLTDFSDSLGSLKNERTLQAFKIQVLPEIQLIVAKVM
ncbi:S8/S53 family peptidase [Methanoregula sp.]|uniref:S8/S53 family peptidase n=1 Tax=Methanoregula sp. TaxID=2052170 RepID=UPI0023730EC0|nr:S8/S53 family peptidase [Methanoregula sp.]MDD1686369.1 S8/S53 family peptidase [Methanoregula sp.]